MSTALSGTSNEHNGAPTTDGQAPNVAKNERQALILSVVAVIVLAALAYSSVLFNFFVGDDFVHLAWLKDAIHNHELIWRNFHNSWLDGTTTKFYRPLISIFMVTDYMISGTNGISFHITNLIFLITGAIFLLFSVREIENSVSPTKTSFLFPMAAGLLFALYPLHPEAVAWITGRVDAICTAFYLISFWSYIRWRKGKSHWAIAMAFMVLGLLSKEMAITLPAAFFACEAFILFDWKKLPTPKDVWNGFAHTLPFWGLLAAYFGLRLWALGTFVGGYDDSLTFISNWHDFIGGWLHGLRMTFVPVNKTLIGDHHVLTILWEVLVGIMVAGAGFNCIKNRGLVRAAVFFLSWICLCLAPVYKIFAIADDLQGSRLAYLATVPICCLFALAFANNGLNNNIAKWFARLMLVLVTALSGTLLAMNNQPWHNAGEQANAIRQGLVGLYKDLPGDPQVMLVGLPDEINGAYVCRNAVAGMTQAPQFIRTLQNCLMVNKFEPILPFGFLKESIAEHHDLITIARWNLQSEKFEHVAIPTPDSLLKNGPKQWIGGTLTDITYGEGETKLVDAPDKSLIIQNDNVRSRPTILLKPEDVPCFNTDFIELKFKFVDERGSIRHPGADLIFTNDLLPTADFHNRVHADLNMSKEPQTVLFSLRSLPEWALGGTSHAFKILLPEGSTVALSEVKMVPASAVMPLITFAKSDYLGTKGFMHLGKDKMHGAISYNVAGVPGAAGVVFEITRANLLFASQNSSEASTVVSQTLKESGTKGDIKIDRSLFPALGLYEGRAWAVDEQGKRLGVAGDHIVFAIDS